MSRCQVKFFGAVVVDSGFNSKQLNEFNENNIIGIHLNLVGRPLFHEQDIDAWHSLFKHINSLNRHVELHCEGERLNTYFA